MMTSRNGREMVITASDSREKGFPRTHFLYVQTKTPRSWREDRFKDRLRSRRQETCSGCKGGGLECSVNKLYNTSLLKLF
ncbi:hypothetical protein TNCV_4314101 [Trichonephila clavipes]|nr:hypothetical protein TNCV_4314101 [Trichonephila clavipes]